MLVLSHADDGAAKATSRYTAPIDPRPDVSRRTRLYMQNKAAPCDQGLARNNKM
jgi:hypothetical protein